MPINQQIFRAYDIRGIVDQTLREIDVYNIGRAIGTQVLALNGSKVVIGRDGRLSGVRLAAKLAAGIIDSGCDVIDVGMVPTPCLYFAAQHLNISSAVMITGSHNPVNYNGLKIIIAGTTIFGEAIQSLYRLIVADKFASGQGKYTQQNIVADYVAIIKNNITLTRPLKIVVDCANGVPSILAPELYQQLGCTVVPLYCSVDGNFPNHHPDPSMPENMQDLIAAVKLHQADLGLAFDGDGDRLGIVDNKGKIIWPDRALMLFAQELLARQPNATIIYDIKCSRDVETVIKQAGGNPIMWNTGHSLIKAKMLETGALLAAEMSGHIFFKDRWFGFDDALYTGARLLELLSNMNESTAQVFATLPEMISTPELMIELNEEAKFSVMQDLISAANFSEHHNLITIDGLRVEFADGWGLVRASNTTPKLVARFEAINNHALQNIQSKFRDLLFKVAPDLIVPF